MLLRPKAPTQAAVLHIDVLLAASHTARPPRRPVRQEVFLFPPSTQPIKDGVPMTPPMAHRTPAAEQRTQLSFPARRSCASYRRFPNPPKIQCPLGLLPQEHRLVTAPLAGSSAGKPRKDTCQEGSCPLSVCSPVRSAQREFCLLENHPKNNKPGT